MASRSGMREGNAPVRDRLLTTLFIAALLHGLLILGLTFNVASDHAEGAPGLSVLLVSDELPEADRNDSATYLAQRTQLGSGDTRKFVAPRNRPSAPPVPDQRGVPDGNMLAPEGTVIGARDQRVVTTTAWNADISYVAEPGDSGDSQAKPLEPTASQSAQPGPEPEAGPAQLRGPQRDELLITPDTQAATLAPYLDAWRSKVERVGTLNYPSAALKAGASGSPVLEVAIDSSGRLEKVAIQRSSGDPQLDQAALDILKLASPFDPFPEDLARQYHVLRFVYEWQFVGGRMERGDLTTVP